MVVSLLDVVAHRLSFEESRVGLNSRHIHDYMLAMVPIVQAMGYRGLPTNPDAMRALRTEIDDRVTALDIELGLYGITHPDSSQALARHLKAAGVPLTRHTKGGTQLATDLETLGWLDFRHNTVPAGAGKPSKYPFLTALLERQRLQTARENLSGMVPCHDGMLRTRLNALGTATARYSSAGFGRKGKEGLCPICHEWGQHGTNMQNLAKENLQLGVNLRRMIQAQPGWVLGQRDYKQLELRIQAYWMRCALLIERLSDPQGDMHSRHAKLAWPDFDMVDKPLRNRRRGIAKNIIYGMRGAGGDRALQAAAAQKGDFIELSDVARVRSAIESDYPEMPMLITDVTRSLQLQYDRGEQRVCYDAFGRPRVLLGKFPLKAWLATVISGTAAGLMNFVLWRMETEHPQQARRIHMQGHDSFTVYAPEEEFADVMGVLGEEMERPVWQWGEFVSYPCDAESGPTLGDLGAWPA